VHGLTFLTTAILLQPAPDGGFSEAQQRQAITATVRVRDVAADAEGSGIVIGRSGPVVYLLTASHVVEGADQVEVAVFSAASQRKPSAVYRSVRVIARERHSDLALLRLTTKDELPGGLSVCPPGRPLPGKDLLALAVGCGERGPSCLVETVQRKRLRRSPESEVVVVWEGRHAQAKGRSGGPLVDRRGWVIGICSGTSGGKGYYCHVEAIHRFLKANGLEHLCDEGK
jgi:S1-C subfamily serine protease